MTALPSDSPIFLVGFMGAGKSTVGRIVAEMLGYDFIDLDYLIEKKSGAPIVEIFDRQGEGAFRSLEREMVLECRKLRRTVIALGGGAYVDAETRRMLRGIGPAVWLECPLEVCLLRARAEGARPLLTTEAEIKRLFESRRPAYANADVAVQAGDAAPDIVAKRILLALEAGSAGVPSARSE